MLIQQQNYVSKLAHLIIIAKILVEHVYLFVLMELFPTNQRENVYKNALPDILGITLRLLENAIMHLLCVEQLDLVILIRTYVFQYALILYQPQLIYLDHGLIALAVINL